MRILTALFWLGAVFAAGSGLVVFADATFGMSRAIYAQIDIPGFAVVLTTALALGFVAVLPRMASRLCAINFSAVSPWVIASAALCVSILGVAQVYHAYALSIDEWMTRLQAEIFLSGRLFATVPEEWREFGRAMYRSFASYDAETGVLSSNYRPGMAALHAAFQLVGLGVYTSAVMNAAAILLVARVARQLVPGNPEAAVVAALLLATSQQALAASLTSYAMSAHLCLNLLWLSLFLDNTPRSHFLAACVGVVTAGLHQIHFHIFFALPFLLTLLRPMQPLPVLIYILVYLPGHVAIYAWDWIAFNSAVQAAHSVTDHTVTAPASTTTGKEVPGILDRFVQMASLPTWNDIATVSANLVRMIAWQSLALLPLLIVARLVIRNHRMLILLVWSLVVSALPYPFLMPDQGHGWGYRYLHGLLGHLVLLAIPGWIVVRRPGGAGAFQSWIVGCLVIAPLVLIPFRAYQIEGLVAPYARGTAMLAAQEADIVIVNNLEVYYGADLARNSPVALERPVHLNDWYLSPDQIRQLCGKYVVVVPAAGDYASLGLHVADTVHPVVAERHVAREAAVASCR